MELEEAIGQAKKGQAILFTGAGFSYGAENQLPPPENKVPDARKFAKYLSELLNKSEEYALQVISKSFMRKNGDHSMVAELLNNFLVTKCQSYHVELAALPWSRVYTTNYDNCFELSALQTGKKWTPITLDALITAQKNLCVHVNGHISNLTVSSLSTQVKLTHTSYSSEAFAHSKWSEQLRQDANTSRAVFFIGYSMADLDIARVFSASPELRDRTFFIVSPHDDEIVTGPLEDYGKVLAIGIEKFAEIVKTIDPPPDLSPHQYTWLQEYVPSTRSSPPEDKNSIDLITKGEVDTASVVWALGSATPSYCVKRTEVDQILSEISNGRRWFLVHSDLGNGKTILKEQLSFFLTRRSYRVFWDTDFDNHKNADLKSLAAEKGEIAVILDATPERFDAIDGILQLNIPNIVVVVCARTTLFELGEARYNEHMPDGYIPIDINKLSPANIQEFVSLFNPLGLWGERALLMDSQKQSFISVDCGGAVSRLIVATFDESEVGRRIRDSASKLLNGRTDLSAVMIASFLLNRIGHTPSPELLTSVINKDVWDLMKSIEFQSAGEFIRFQSGRVTIRSSIISDYLLKTSIRPDVLVWHVERFVRRLSEIKRSSTLHHIFTELQRFPVVGGIVAQSRDLSRSKQRDIIVGYFQSISSIPFCQRNALFWLHYAMARLQYGEFDVAAIYFGQAREYAKGNISDTRDVNNHFARLLLESRIQDDSYSDYFKAFEMAHRILLEQMNRDTNRHYPYRQARNYVEFISHRKSKLSPAETKSFISACKQVQSAISNVRGTLAGSQEVVRCSDAMKRAIEIAELSNEP